MSDIRYQDLSERECAAIRGAVGPWGECTINESDMTISIRDHAGVVRIPRAAAIAYHEAWRRSGQWSLRGAS